MLIAHSPPANPLDRLTVVGCIYDAVVNLGGFGMPVARDAVAETAQAYYDRRNPGTHTTLASVDRLIRAAAEQLLPHGIRLFVPRDEKGKRMDGRLRIELRDEATDCEGRQTSPRPVAIGCASSPAPLVVAPPRPAPNARVEKSEQARSCGCGGGLVQVVPL